MCVTLSLGSLLFVHEAVPASRVQEAKSLYAQATSAMLERGFPSPQVEYLLLDARTREVIAIRWSHPETPIPVGSLLKPFVTLAYGRAEAKRPSDRSASGTPIRGFPMVVCRGKVDGCWREDGHGTLGLERALALSCNAYFLALARGLLATPQGQLDQVSTDYGLPLAPLQKTAPMLIGATPEWRVTPAALAESYAALLDEFHAPKEDGESLARIHEGMEMAAGPGGTAARIGRHPGGVLAKTGTAPCIKQTQPELLTRDNGTDQCRINGDGLVILAAPAENPRWLLLVRQRGTTGAITAVVAGEMLSRLEASDAPRD